MRLIEMCIRDSFPTVTLSAGAGLESSSWKHLFDWPSRFWSLGPSVSQTIFSAQLEPGLNQYVETYNADVATYRQTVLTLSLIHI